MVAILLLAPVLGDCLTGATPPVDVVLWPPGAVLLIAFGMFGGKPADGVR